MLLNFDVECLKNFMGFVRRKKLGLFSKLLGLRKEFVFVGIGYII